jgi:hypothetical protein
VDSEFLKNRGEIFMRTRMLLSIVLVVLFVIPVTLVSAQQENQVTSDKKRTLGILLYPGFEVLDAYGPIEL